MFVKLYSRSTSFHAVTINLYYTFYYWAFNRCDRRPDSSARLRLHTTGRSNQSGRPVGQTVAEPGTSVNQINVACQLIGHNFCCRWSKAKNGGQFRVYDSCSSQ